MGPGRGATRKSKPPARDCESYFLANFMSRLNPDTQLRLLGYSFGGRIVSGALHLAGGGTLGRFQLADANSRPPNSVRVVLLAAAMDNYWWLPGRYHGECFSQVDRLLLLYNSCDPVLRFYPRLDRGRGARRWATAVFAGRAAWAKTRSVWSKRTSAAGSAKPTTRTPISLRKRTCVPCERSCWRRSTDDVPERRGTRAPPRFANYAYVPRRPRQAACAACR